jgi:hypothetical protein
MSGANQGPTTVTQVKGGTITTTSSGTGSADTPAPATTTQQTSTARPANLFVQRAVDVIVRLGKGNFGEDGYDQVTLKGLRVSAHIQKLGYPDFNRAQVAIFGMKLDLMNKLTTLGLPNIANTRVNHIMVMAGDAGSTSPRPVVFEGLIIEAWAAFEGMPEVAFNIQAQTGADAQMKPVPASSYPGSADAVVIMQSLAKVMGRDFENNDVPVTMLSNPYFPGTAAAQAEACARAANIGWMLDDKKLSIFPVYGNRSGVIPLISPKTGMVGYPGYAGPNIHVRTLYNPAIKFNGTIKVESDVTNANGEWRVRSLEHYLESEMPNGAWFSDIEADKLFAAA